MPQHIWNRCNSRSTDRDWIGISEYMTSGPPIWPNEAVRKPQEPQNCFVFSVLFFFIWFVDLCQYFYYYFCRRRCCCRFCFCWLTIFVGGTLKPSSTLSVIIIIIVSVIVVAVVRQPHCHHHKILYVIGMPFLCRDFVRFAVRLKGSITAFSFLLCNCGGVGEKMIFSLRAKKGFWIY